MPRQCVGFSRLFNKIGIIVLCPAILSDGSGCSCTMRVKFRSESDDSGCGCTMRIKFRSESDSSGCGCTIRIKFRSESNVDKRRFSNRKLGFLLYFPGY